MNNFEEKNSIPKIYQITGSIAFLYSAILLVFTIYNQFIYIDGTWVHGFLANGFAVLSSLIWIGILFVFKQFLVKILNYGKATLLINTYMIFLAITIISVASVLYKSVELYFSLEDTESFNALTGFATTSISGAILLFISNFVIILICILLGNQIRKIDVVEKKLFQFIGLSLILYGAFSLLTSISIIESDIFQFLVKIILVILIGIILKKVYQIDSIDLHSSTRFEKLKNLENLEPKYQESTTQNTEIKKSEKVYTTQDNFPKDVSKRDNVKQTVLPNLNLDNLEDKELVLTYYNNLPKEELSRLETIIETKYGSNLTTEQKITLVQHYIAEKKLYDHQRFLPQ